MAGVNAKETGNEVSQPTLEFTPLLITDTACNRLAHSGLADNEVCLFTNLISIGPFVFVFCPSVLMT